MQKCFYANDFYLGDTEVQTDTFPLFNYIYLLYLLYTYCYYTTRFVFVGWKERGIPKEFLLHEERADH
jgi:hypothetical protein